QANISNVSTVATGNVLVNRGTIPPTNPVAVRFGGQELEPETSINITGGIVMNFSDSFSVTADYYNIQVFDRISQSRTITLTSTEAAELEADGIRGASDLQEFRFFTNAFDTMTQGVDVVATTQLDFEDAGRTQLSLAYAWNQTRVGDFLDTAIDIQRIAELEDALPNHRFVLTGTHLVGPFRFMLRGSFYDSFQNPSNASGDLSDIDDFTYGATFLVDAEIGYSFFEDHFQVVVGAANLLNTFPDENSEGFQRALGAVYPENSPIGFNGGFYYFRLQAQL
ncbi:MAG: TonB-dependent receptor, partial [Myxococcota bacterium]